MEEVKAAVARKMCWGKMPYATESIAIYALDNFFTRCNNTIYLNTYRCKVCGKWHIGNNKPKKNKKK